MQVFWDSPKSRYFGTVVGTGVGIGVRFGLLGKYGIADSGVVITFVPGGDYSTVVDVLNVGGDDYVIIQSVVVHFNRFGAGFFLYIIMITR